MKVARGVNLVPLMTYGAMRWRQTFFVHWLVPADTLTPRLPRGVTLDRWRGHAVASLSAIDVEGPAPRALLQTPVAHLFRYRQLNLRTYVEGPEGPGLTLLETRIDRVTWALGARLAGMPYHLDRQLALRGARRLRGAARARAARDAAWSATLAPRRSWRARSSTSRANATARTRSSRSGARSACRSRIRPGAAARWCSKGR